MVFVFLFSATPRRKRRARPQNIRWGEGRTHGGACRGKGAGRLNHGPPSAPRGKPTHGYRTEDGGDHAIAAAAAATKKTKARALPKEMEITPPLLLCFLARSSRHLSKKKQLSGARACLYLRRKLQPSCSRARPPVGVHSTVEQLPHSTTVCECEKTVVMEKQPWHLTSMKNELGDWTNLWLLLLSVAVVGFVCGCWGFVGVWKDG